MHTYQTSNPRALFGMFAVALTAITLSLTVVVPATLDNAATADTTLAQGNPAAPIATDAAPMVYHIDVVGTREG